MTATDHPLAAPYVFTVPCVAPSLNEWKKWHWAKQDRERKAFQEQVWGSLNEKGNRAPRGLERVALHAVVFCATPRRRDSDNFGALLHKWVQDSLVRAKVIPDDTADRCTFAPPKIRVNPDGQPLTLITMQEVR